MPPGAITGFGTKRRCEKGNLEIEKFVKLAREAWYSSTPSVSAHSHYVCLFETHAGTATMTSNPPRMESSGENIPILIGDSTWQSMASIQDPVQVMGCANMEDIILLLHRS